MAHLIGQAMTVAFWYPTAIVQCHCKEGELTLVVLTGISNLTGCGKCHRLYRIEKVEASALGPRVVVGLVLPSDPSKVM